MNFKYQTPEALGVNPADIFQNTVDQLIVQELHFARHRFLVKYNIEPTTALLNLNHYRAIQRAETPFATNPEGFMTINGLKVIIADVETPTVAAILP